MLPYRSWVDAYLMRSHSRELLSYKRDFDNVCGHNELYNTLSELLNNDLSLG